GEYVMSEPAVQAIGVDRLESLHRSAKGYASGGFVGAAAPAPAPAAANPSNSGQPAASIKVVNVLDPGDVFEAGLATSIGEKAFLNFITRNSRATRGAISS